MSSFYPIYMTMQATKNLAALQIAALALSLVLGWLLIRRMVPVKFQEFTRWAFLVMIVFLGGYSLTWI